MTREDRQSGYYSELETESPQARQERKWTAALEAMQLAWDHVGEFRSRLEGAGLRPEDIRSQEDWQKIPVLHKKDIISLQASGAKLQEMLACQVGELGRIFLSPGPILDPEGRGADYWGWTEAFHAAGFRANDVVQMTFGYHLTPAGLMLEEPLRTLGCAVIPAGPGNTSTQIELLTGLPVTGFVGMASYLKIIKDEAVTKGLDLGTQFNLKTAFVAAERLSDSLRNELEQELGITVRQGYGTADVGCIAYECPMLGGMHTASSRYVEICDPETGKAVPDGEVGEVVVTPFNQAYPLVRLATGDLSFFIPRECSCGRTAKRLGGIVGRVDLTVKVRGQFLYPHQIGAVMAGFQAVQRWQVVVDNLNSRDSLTLRLLLAEELDQGKLLQEFKEKLKLRPELVIAQNEGELPEGAPPVVDKRTY
jgi:phenylacetate-CoA ligase